MNTQVTIVTYHYVRPIRHSRYPQIKGLETSLFKSQLEYFSKNYTFISPANLMNAIDASAALPANSILLTFDDGYLEHFTQVFPLLDAMGISGAFFPSAKVVSEHSVLDVNKIHFVLASVDDKSAVIKDIYRGLNEFRSEFDLKNNDEYWQEFAVDGRYDTAEVVFIKRMLQKGLPEKLRSRLADQLFMKYVSADEASFAHELYMSEEQIALMHRSGQCIGSHGYEHCWLDTLDRQSQMREVDLSLELLERIGVDQNRWIMCYPYGAYNQSLVDVVGERGCKVGLTIDKGVADISVTNSLTLPRLDTNEFTR